MFDFQLEERVEREKILSELFFGAEARLVAAASQNRLFLPFPESEAPRLSPRALPSLEPSEHSLLAPRGNEVPPHAAHQAPLLPRRRRRRRSRAWRNDASVDGFFFLVFFASFRGIVGVGVDDDECRSSPQPLPPAGLGLARRGPAVAGQVVQARRRLVRGAQTERKREQEGVKFEGRSEKKKHGRRVSRETSLLHEAPVLASSTRSTFFRTLSLSLAKKTNTPKTGPPLTCGLLSASRSLFRSVEKER